LADTAVAVVADFVRLRGSYAAGARVTAGARSATPAAAAVRNVRDSRLSTKASPIRFAREYLRCDDAWEGAIFWALAIFDTVDGE
jgi:hypothetical protein